MNPTPIIDKIKRETEKVVALYYTDEVEYFQAQTILKLCSAFKLAIEQRDYVADYPIEGPESIDQMNKALEDILTEERG